jgi:iron(III) transport system ATP-binding protein
MSTDLALRLVDVAKRFGRTLAVADVTLDLAPGELLTLVGPSGCGKSTLLRLIAGLHVVDSGRIEIGGVVVDDGRRRLDPERRHVGLVFQDHSLFPHMTVAANVGFGVRDVTRHERTVRVSWLLELVGCGGLADRYPHEISGGERQRVALARAIAPRPRVLLFDEPFASLDPVLRAGVRAEIVALLRRAGTSAVFVTHDQTEALAVGDRVAVLCDGRVQQLGTPEVVYGRPANRFVAGLMGEASFLPVWEEGGSLVTELGPARRSEADHDVPAEDLVAVVRPNTVELVSDAQGTAVVSAVEFRGATRAYTLRLHGGGELLVSTDDRVVFAVGARVTPKLSTSSAPVTVRA